LARINGAKTIAGNAEQQLGQAGINAGSLVAMRGQLFLRPWFLSKQVVDNGNNGAQE